MQFKIAEVHESKYQSGPIRLEKTSCESCKLDNLFRFT